ncbi:MAG: hypothetical protein H8D34_26480 [Chloroflexi bacterium]|nr:hypothetical protein [Chloroflexota bacterium]
MGRYDRLARQSEREEKGIHPVWRGIGCVLFVLLPVMSYAGAVELVKANYRNGWFAVPSDLAQAVAIPYIGVISHLYAYLAVGVVLLVFGFGILTIVYSVLNTTMGPPKYGPTDAPPPRRPKKRRKY